MDTLRAVEAQGRSGDLAMMWRMEGGCKVKDSNTYYGKRSSWAMVVYWVL